MSLKEKLKSLLFKDGKLIVQMVRGNVFNNYEKGNLLNEVVESTSFLDLDVKVSERIYCIINDIFEKKKCKLCNKNYTNFIKYSKGYNTYCSSSCVNKDQEIIKKKELNSMIKYGVKSPLMLQSTKDKTKQTIFCKYGTDYQKIVLEKRKKTNLVIYGSECVFSNDIVKQKIKNTIQKKYGVKSPLQNNEILQKLKKTVKERYGVDNVLKNEEIKKKVKKTILKRYGVDNIMKNNAIKQISKNTIIKKYGVDNISKNSEIRKKIIETVVNKYGVNHISQNEIIKQKIKDTRQNIYNTGLLNTSNNALLKYNNLGKLHNINILFENGIFSIDCKICNNVTIETSDFINQRLNVLNITPCTFCQPRNSSISGIENFFYSFIKEIYNGNIIQSDRTQIKPLELDLYLEDVKIAIEINGLYWHSDLYRNKNYHYDKFKVCEDKGIQLFQFFEDEIPQAMMLMYSIIYNLGKLKNNIDIKSLNIKYGLSLVFTKKYYLKDVLINKIMDKYPYKKLLKKYHIEGDDNAKYYYSLENKDGQILSIMTFKKMSVNKNQLTLNSKDTYELSRYVTLPGIQIIGGFKKILIAFIKDYPKSTIVTYSNLRYSNKTDNVYYINGFKNIGFTGINYYYFFKSKKYHRFNFRKDNLYNNILPKYGISVSDNYKKESEIGMRQKLNDNGHSITKIFDCGNIKWLLSN